MALSAGTRLGPYEIIAPLGKGGMGEVFRASDTRLQRTVAIKTLPHDKVADPERKRRFLQEARAASALNHPNIVTLHDIASDGGVDYLVMEYVPGRSLDQLIAPRGVPLSEALGYAQQIASALAAAHGAGIIHRDIKPGNVIVTPESQLKVLDFGLAKLAERPSAAEDETRTQESAMTEAGTVMGTVGYMSPEQAGAKPLDHRTDIFSLGVVLYEMLAGARPFRGNSQVETLHAIMHAPAPPLTNQPPEVEEVLAKALAKDVKDRYQHAGDFALDMRRLQRAWEAKSLPSMRSAPETTPKRHPGWAIAAAVLVIGALAGAWLSRRAAPRSDWLADVSITPFTAEPGYEGDPSFSPDGQTIAYVSDRTGRFDIYLRQIGTTSDVALTHDQGDNVQPAFSPDGRQIAFVSSRAGDSTISHPCCDYPLQGGDVWVMPALGGAARRVTTDGNHPSWSPDGETIVFTRFRQGLFKVSPAGGEVRQILMRFESTPATQWFASVYSSEGRWIFFESQIGQGTQSPAIFAVPASGGTAKLIVRGWHPSWDAAAQAVVYTNSDEGKNNSLWTLPFSTSDGKASGDARPLTVGRGRDWQPVVSPDGKRIAFTAIDASFNLEAVPFDAEAGRSLGPPRELTTGNQIIYFMRFSPDGRSVVYQRSQGAGTHIWRLDIGHGPLQLTFDPRFEDTNPQWSPDGKAIAFHRNLLRTGNSSLWLMAPDGTDPRQVWEGKDDFVPRWIPDGSGLIYHSTQDHQYYFYALATGQSRRITNEQGVGGMAGVSADGQWIAYQSIQGVTTNQGVHVIPFSGGQSRLPAPSPHFEGHPLFSPSGRWLYFQHEHKNLYRVPGPAQDWKPAEPQKVTDFAETAGLFLEDPQFSRDGKQLLFSRGKINGDIWILRRGK